MFRIASFAALLVLSVSGAADSPADTLPGDYSAVAITHDGTVKDAEFVKGVTLVIAKGEMTFKVKDKSFPAKIKLDEKAKPAGVDISPTEGTDNGRTFLGIWKLENGELWLCFRERGDRPTEFKGGNGAILFRLKRDAKK
jgi:uncharacterized protein (TIGR03067 family)